jgi:hypothetical protein
LLPERSHHFPSLGRAPVPNAIRDAPPFPSSKAEAKNSQWKRKKKGEEVIQLNAEQETEPTPAEKKTPCAFLFFFFLP